MVFMFYKIFTRNIFAEVQKSYRSGDHRSFGNIANLTVHIVGDGVTDIPISTVNCRWDDLASLHRGCLLFSFQ